MDILLFGKNHGEHGPTRVTRGLATGLSALGHNVEMVTYGDRQDSPKDDIQVISFPKPNRSVASWRKLYSNVEDIVKKIDCDIFHALERYPYQSDLRTVQWTSDSYIVWRRAERQRLNIRTVAGDAILNWMSRRGATQSGSVIASSPETKRQMESLWRLSPDSIIPPGIESEYRSPPAPSGEKLRVLFVGRFEQRKGYDRILPRLDPNDKRFEVCIAGGIADEDYARPFLEAGWRDHYLGYVDDSTLETEYESADVVVIPSYLENFSMVALEAVSKGCALVISRECGFAQFEWATPENGVYVVDSGQAAVNTLKSMISDPDIDNKKNAAFRLSNRLTWETIAEKYILEYKSVLSRAGH